jgi:hypothetical protein
VGYPLMLQDQAPGIMDVDFFEFLFMFKTYIGDTHNARTIIPTNTYMLVYLMSMKPPLRLA